MKLYLYISSGTALEFFTQNRLVCNAYLKSRQRKTVDSLGMVAEKFLFLSPKRLGKEQRMDGFAQDFVEMPLTIELEIDDEDAKLLPILEVMANGETAVEFKPLSAMQESSLGAFVKGEISFSYVSRILFADELAQERIFRPSKDLYFPEHLYGVLSEDFCEEISLEAVRKAGKLLNDKYTDDNVVQLLCKRNKQMALLMTVVQKTEDWPIGERYGANFDEVVLQLLGWQDKADDLMEGQYAKLRMQTRPDGLLAMSDIFADEADKQLKRPTCQVSFWQGLIRMLSELTVQNFTQEEFSPLRKAVFSVLENLGYTEKKRTDLNKAINEIEELVYGSAKTGLTKLLEKMPEYLRGLLFFLRTPQSAAALTEALLVYKTDAMTRRYAWLLFAALNGLEGLPGEMFERTAIFDFAERKALLRYAEKDMSCRPSSDKIFKDEDYLVPQLNEHITMEDVRSFLMVEENTVQLHEAFDFVIVKKLAGSKLKEKEYLIVSNMNMDKPELSIAEIEEQLRIAKKEAKLKLEKFKTEWVEDEKKFALLYKDNNTAWQSLYKKWSKY